MNEATTISMDILRDEAVNLGHAMAEKKRLEDALTEVNKEIQQREAKLRELKEPLGIGERVDLDGVGTLRFEDVLSTKVTDAEAYSKWLEANNLQHLATLNVVWQRTRSLVKERLEQGLGAPDGVEFSNFVKVSLK